MEQKQERKGIARQSIEVGRMAGIVPFLSELAVEHDLEFKIITEDKGFFRHYLRYSVAGYESNLLKFHERFADAIEKYNETKFVAGVYKVKHLVIEDFVEKNELNFKIKSGRFSGVKNIIDNINEHFEVYASLQKETKSFLSKDTNIKILGPAKELTKIKKIIKEHIISKTSATKKDISAYKF